MVAEIVISSWDLLGFAVGMLLSPFLVMWLLWVIFNDLKTYNEERDKDERKRREAESHDETDDCACRKRFDPRE